MITSFSGLLHSVQFSTANRDSSVLEALLSFDKFGRVLISTLSDLLERVRFAALMQTSYTSGLFICSQLNLRSGPLRGAELFCLQRINRPFDSHLA